MTTPSPLRAADPQPLLSDASAMLRLLDRMLPPTGGAVRLVSSEVMELLHQARMLRESIALFGAEARRLAEAATEARQDAQIQA